MQERGDGRPVLLKLRNRDSISTRLDRRSFLRKELCDDKPGPRRKQRRAVEDR
jgi:hypothetical protein